MKQLFLAAILMIATAATALAQTGADKLRTQASNALEAKEYVTARYYYLKAYQAFAEAGKMDAAVDCAVNAAALYHRENYYKEAFEALSRAEMALNAAEQGGTPQPALHYPIARERQRMYIKLKRPDSAGEWLRQMESWAQKAASRDIDIDLLSTQAQQYYAFGQTERGDAAVNKLIALYLSDGDYDKADECYKKIIDMALRTNNARLVSRSYDKYLAWNDSISAVRAAEHYDSLRTEYDAACQTIADRDSSITAKNAIIIGLCILAAILAGVLIFAVLAWLRALAVTRRQKREIETAHRREEVKNRFVANIAESMAPTIDTLPQGDPAVKALRDFTTHIQTLSELEAERAVPYPAEDISVAPFLEAIAAEVQPELAPGVSLTVNAPKMSAHVAPDGLREVLLHLLRNAAIHTPADGRITLEFKKRGPHNIQFIVTDSGPGVDEQLRDDLFVPFARHGDLRDGDGLGLPTAAVRTERLGGTLSLDTTWRQGARFVIELHP